MNKVYEATWLHASRNKITNKIELTKFINANTDMNIMVGGLAINTIIRQAYNYFMKKKEYQKAYQILDTYKPIMYEWKVLNNYNR